MVDITLRTAAEEDFSSIRRLTYLVQNNPAQLDWRRFILAADRSGHVVGCGQLKGHGKDIMELSSIAVEPDFRYRGIGRAIIEYLIARAPRPLYLTCRSGLEVFYNKWNFHVIHGDDLPSYYKHLVRMVMVTSPLSPHRERMIVMELA